MYCPGCDSEYRPGITRCPQCDVPLQEDPPKHPERPPKRPKYASEHPLNAPQNGDYAPPPELVVVFAGSSDDVAIAQSILMSAGIEFTVNGEHDPYGGSFPLSVGGPLQILVRAEDAEDSRALLAGPDSWAPTDDDLEADDSCTEDESEAGSSGSLWGSIESTAKFAAVVFLVALLAQGLVNAVLDLLP